VDSLYGIRRKFRKGGLVNESRKVRKGDKAVSGPIGNSSFQGHWPCFQP
jgi:hypothetical protein